MSSIDPFGSSSSTYGHNRRGKSAPGEGRAASGFINNVGQTFSGLASDVGQQFGKKGTRKHSWQQIGVGLGLLNVIYGVCMMLWALIAMRNHLSGGFGLVLGISIAGVGGAGLLTARASAHGWKTLYLFSTLVVGGLAILYLLQTGYATRQDCVLAETFLRLDHLEDALHKVKHEEMINGLLMKMDHLQVELEHVKDHAVDVAELETKKTQYQQQDAQYIDAKLMQLLQLADRAFGSMDEKIAEYDRNITALEQPNAAEEHELTSAQLKARVRSLQYRQRTLQPRKDALREMLQKLDEHRESADLVSMEEYEQMIKTLELNTAQLESDLKEEVRAERTDMPQVKASSERLQSGEYSNFAVGDYKQRADTRTSKQNAQRKMYEDYMTKVNRERQTTLTNKERYIRSLNDYLENMPEHCMEDLSTMLPGQLWALGALLLLGATGYVSLTSTVMSVKKDY